MKNHRETESFSLKARESEPLVKILSGRYGALALTRAAAEAAAAERSGNHEQIALWRGVVTDLRQNIVLAESWV